MTTNIYGQDVELRDLEDGEMVTEVIVLARAIRFREDGQVEEVLLSNKSASTTPIVAQGMVNDFMMRLPSAQTSEGEM